MPAEETFDIVVVGAGSAGSAVAGRLAQSGRLSVLLLEAGPRDRSPWVHLPIGYGKLFYSPRLNWMYRTEPQPELAGRDIYQPRGKVVGGSSSINAMVYSRGQPSDFDGWAAAGNPGWSWTDVLPVYRRMEDHALGASAVHGSGGPLHVSDISGQAHPLTDAFLAACVEAGLQRSGDLNAGSIEGVGYYQTNTYRGLRSSAAKAYVRPAVREGRLTLRAECLVTRLVLDAGRAVGVEYRRGGRACRATARGGVVLSAGAFNTPQLLQLSGIGPGPLLQRIGVPVQLNVPAVGRNLQDHLCYDHVYRATKPSLNEDLLPLGGRVRIGLSYLFGRRGPLSMSLNQGGGFYRTRDDAPGPDMQLYFQPLSYERAQPGVRALMKPDPFPGFSTSVSPCHPRSRGTVEVRSPDPAVPPRIDPRYLSDPADLAVMLGGARFLRRLRRTPALSGIIAEELKPGDAAATDAELEADIRSRAYSVFHPCGTCRMGPDPHDAVVDARLRVHGMANLWIADASVFPAITSGNTNAPSIMIGERASDLILEDTRR
jgi:choline dehydrogenase